MSTFSKFFAVSLFFIYLFPLQQISAATFVVDNTTDNDDLGAYAAGTNSLKKCIRLANAAVGPHTINFSVAGTITLTSALQILVQRITVDGTTAPGWVLGAPVVEISGNNAIGPILQLGLGSGETSAGLKNGSTIKGLVINRSSSFGIFIQNSSGNTIKQCFIGSDLTGTAAQPNTYHGIEVNGSVSAGGTINNTIGGTSTDDRNIISGNTQAGIRILSNADNTIVQNNYIGVSVSGNTAVKNGRIFGVSVNHGIIVETNCDNTQILSNVISANGTSNGGTLPSPPGTYAANGSGINIIDNSTGTIIKSNLIGVGADGVTPLGNVENGINVMTGSIGTIIGSSSVADRNIICKHGFHAINIQTFGAGSSPAADIKGNIIGTDASMTLDLGNQDDGVFIMNTSYVYPSTIIGGKGANDGNILVNSKEGSGIRIQDSDNMAIWGNYIGTTTAKITTMGNFASGILFANYGSNSSSNIVGASTPEAPATGEPNIIAHNGGDGVKFLVTSVGNFANPIKGNSIFCNVGKGINTSGTQNDGLTAPTVTTRTATLIEGTVGGGPDKTIHVYTNNTAGTYCDCEGEVFLGTTTASGAGAWSLAVTITAAQAASATATLSGTGVKGTSEFSTCTVPLPVQLVNFEVWLDNQQAVLNWTTSSEVNTRTIEIEKSTDGGETFFTIETILLNGNSNTLKKYSFIDEDLFQGTAYYRLKMSDIDETESYSPIKSLNYYQNSISLYPNPAQNFLEISSQRTAGRNDAVEIKNILGCTVLESALNSEGNTTTVDISTLPTGIYLVSVFSGNEITTKKITKNY